MVMWTARISENPLLAPRHGKISRQPQQLELVDWFSRFSRLHCIASLYFNSATLNQHNKQIQHSKTNKLAPPSSLMTQTRKCQGCLGCTAAKCAACYPTMPQIWFSGRQTRKSYSANFRGHFVECQKPIKKKHIFRIRSTASFSTTSPRRPPAQPAQPPRRSL